MSATANATNAQAGPSSTPPRPNPTTASSPLKSTPNNRGTATISSHIRFLGANVKNLRPWIKHDVAEADRRPVDDILRTLLQRASNNPNTTKPDLELLPRCLKAVLKVCNNESKIHEALERYVKPGNEKAYYGPFIDAANTAFAHLANVTVKGMRAVSELDIICQLNDPNIMPQLHDDQKSLRKPDIVIIPFSYEAFPLTEDRRKARDQRLHDAKKKPEAPLVWKDPLACIEFKRFTKTELPPPATTYEVAPYCATKPEYWTLDDHVPETPATAEKAISQPKSAQAAPTMELRRSARSSTQKASSESKRKAEEAELAASAAAKRPKIDDEEGDLDVTVQTGLYAAEMFAANLAATRVINLIVVDDILWIWYYDRQGIVQSSGINFLKDRPRFMVLLFALQRFGPGDWGRNTAFIPQENGQSHKINIEGIDLELHTSDPDRFTHYGLKGRATNVFPVTSKTLLDRFPHVKKDGMVAKIFWAEEQRASEPDILKKVEEIANKYPQTVKGHVPELLWYHKFDEPTSEVRELLGAPEPSKGSRVLYILVFRRLRPITELQGKDLFDVWGQCIHCHFDLWHADEGVNHRDVSSPNLMYYRDDNGKLIGVLNDYDLSSLASALGPQGNERTGTVPFMALDLLTEEGQEGKVKHLYRHDLESFVWVLSWVVLRYKDGKLLTSGRPLDDWATKDALTVCEKKSYFLQNFAKLVKPSSVDVRIWNLLLDCLQVVKTQANHRENILYAQMRLGGKHMDDIDLSDAEFLQLFTNTGGWVDLSDV